ncbi:HPr family phosphocarrier protein [Priestia megaterium]|uniref:HPr family phosphocarrier protein n=1 Tax=Priestia megaterium TaxID=1404 RepID=UPI0021F475C9|nr:HPr family phosphocarrier protein [Priestia megaterium]UYP07338.1 HPr family phosphocarrier protein [Priestia megaterium]
MKERKLVVNLENGLEARIATKFVQMASSFNSEVTIVKQEKSVIGKSIMGVMALAVRKGEKITLITNGNDEQEAIESLENFLSNRL